MKSSRSRLAVAVAPIALIAAALALVPVSGTRADDDHGNDGKFQVLPRAFDPSDTDLVQTVWLSGTGCPTGASTSLSGGKQPDGPPYADPACPTGDPKDRDNQGLLLVKTGPTGNFAAGFAVIKGLPKNLVLTELGYDIRKPGADQNDPRGSHCGAGAPRFNITTTTDSFFLGCNSPPATSDTPGTGWQRLRWGGTAPLQAFSVSTGQLVTVTGTVKELSIVFDEGQDTGTPDNFGAAILDNIDVNKVLVGRGPSDAAH